MTFALETSKGLQQREEILAVARKRLVEEGYNHFVLREIAAQCGMTIGNLQYYFRTRELLLEAVTRAALFDDLKTLDAISQSAPRGKAQLRELASAILRKWLGENDKIYAVASFLSRSEPAFRSLLSELYGQFFDHLIVVLKINPSAETESANEAVSSGYHAGAFGRGTIQLRLLQQDEE